MGRCMTRRRLRRAVFGGFLCAVAIGAAGCSSEISRFGESPNSNPYAARASSRQSAAAPIQPAAVPIQPTRTTAVESQPLPQAQSANSPYAPQYAALQYEQPQYAPSASQYVPPQPVPPQPVASYAPPAPQYPPPQSVPPYAPPAPRSTSDFTGAAGGGAKLAHAAAPRTAMSAAAPQVSAPGVAVPTTSASLPAAPALAAMPMSRSVVGSSAQTLLPTPPVHTVGSGDTLGKVARRYRVSVREIAVANGMAPETPLRVGARLTIPVRMPSPSAPPAKLPPGAPMVAQTTPITAPHTYTPAAQASGKLASSDTAANVHMRSPVEPPPG